MYLYNFFFFDCAVRLAGILIPRPGIEPMPPAVEAQSPNQWTAREFPLYNFFKTTPGFIRLFTRL